MRMREMPADEIVGTGQEIMKSLLLANPQRDISWVRKRAAEIMVAIACEDSFLAYLGELEGFSPPLNSKDKISSRFLSKSDKMLEKLVYLKVENQ